MEKPEDNADTLYTLIPLEDFKALMSVDDRDDRLCRFCLVTSTLTIEQYCMRKLLRKKHFEQIEFTGDLLIPLREYPVIEVLAFYVFGNGEILEPEFYRVNPECGIDFDIPFSLNLSPALLRYPSLSSVKAVYWAGYQIENVPADLSSACLELASWNFNRYKGRRVGMTGNIRGSGKEGEHFELSLPENVKALLEPYKRKTI